MKEEWKDIRGYEGLYQISSLGRAKSLERIRKSRLGYTAKVAERILVPSLLKYSGYLRYCLSKNGRTKNFRINILVWDHFGNEPRGSRQVDHKKGKKFLNGIVDLQLLTPRENVIKYCKTKTKKHNLPTGVFQHCTKYSARIYADKRSYSLGDYSTPEEAGIVYERARRLINRGIKISQGSVI